MANIFFLKTGDTYPNIFTQLSDENGIVDLTGCTVLFRMSQVGTGNLLIEEPAVVLAQGEPDNLGKCYYEWQVGDTDIAGTYRVEWRVTFPGDKIATFPRGTPTTGVTALPVYNEVIIQASVD